MSVKNKAKDRGVNGKILRKYTGEKSNHFPDGAPGWWVNMFMNRPKRRENKRLCRRIKEGECYDALVFPLGNHKPHHYYW